ncbi:Nucleotide-binding universal stress protein, UspA family [Pseudorhodobacter antarcticus]|uniref:Nucleotide-binding universal stress protein, UspA family n=1 Tax=Pseudorhodobacter antarcticus TaxID=1077947 RepID=A0A1H8MCX0_9RHOB|nr:universal stress protein [Pseudorhodobacter antarcticus]SEO15205.1 Nucleotide-binding universal stress protein, UspA family [Pseudorhodobacter antarcticus]
MTSYAKTRISNPARYFKTPDIVLRDNRLSRDDKAKVLRSMAVDADQMLEATSEGMTGAKPAYDAKELQSALIQLEKNKEHGTVDESRLQNARFQRIMVVTTVNQDMNREIADVAFDMAEIMGGKVYLLSVVPPALEETGLSAAGHMGTVIPLGSADNIQVIEDRNKQLAELAFDSGTDIETEIEVRIGQVEEAIIEYADDCEADIIVVGSPNRSWLEALFESSIASRVTKSAPCPVLIVPQQT